MTTVALVDDNTPDHQEYGTYRGWVGLDKDGAWVENLTQEQVDSLDITWSNKDDWYGKDGRVNRK